MLTPDPQIAISLLCVCKRIHDEAAPIFYGNKEFILSVGWLDRTKSGPQYFDNLSWIPLHYLRMVKKCVLDVKVGPPQGSSFLLQMFVGVSRHVKRAI